MEGKRTEGMRTERTRAVVVGSGFGGAVAALRLGQAGIETVVLERGRRWTVEDPTTDATYATFARPDGRAGWLTSVTRTPAYEGTPIEVYTGVLDVVVKGGTTFMIGTGVGGGSHVYGGILAQPPREMFRLDFPAGIDYDEMDGVYFPRVRSVIPTAPIPDDILASEYFTGLRVFVEHARRAGFVDCESTADGSSGIVRLPMAVDWEAVRDEIAGKRIPSLIAAEFWYGNNSGAKPALDTNYLALAEDTGAVQIRPLHVVGEVEEVTAAGGGYRVRARRIDTAGVTIGEVVLECDILVLAAGTFGTTELLLRARERAGLTRLDSSLGYGFGNIGDIFMVRGGLGELTNPHLGAPGCIAVLDFANPVRPTTTMRAPLPRFAQDFPRLDAMGAFYFSRTPNRGRLSYDPDTDSVRLSFSPDSDSAARNLAERMNAAAGGKVVSSTADTTGHQLGGACMGLTCDTEGRVSGHPGLYVLDGALLPGSSTCVNPALTIAAVAERAMDRILTDDISFPRRAPR